MTIETWEDGPWPMPSDWPVRPVGEPLQAVQAVAEIISRHYMVAWTGGWEAPVFAAFTNFAEANALAEVWCSDHEEWSEDITMFRVLTRADGSCETELLDGDAIDNEGNPL